MAVTIGLSSEVAGIIGAILGAGISAGTTWLLARNDRNKFARERTWDLRMEAYSSIVAQLTAAASWARLIERGYHEDPHGYDRSHNAVRQGQQFAYFYQEAKTKYTLSRLILSTSFAQRFERMMRAIEEIEVDDVDPPEGARRTLAIMEEVAADLLAMGIAETRTADAAN